MRLVKRANTSADSPIGASMSAKHKVRDGKNGVVTHNVTMIAALVRQKVTELR